MKNPVIQIREAQNINRSEFSRKTGIPYATLTGIERGLTSDLSEKTAERLAKFGGGQPTQIKQEFQSWRESLMGVKV